ncbi:hypothetical protein BO70DRAFT_430163 [Aspergillus heteromorphus CBS 117.55]|uniref:Uncharacterized protein n=1 Tax=Aspergillus heteromorphus CBS 117.55 TaxID=1448321 RepID=A0A317VWU4_9EURO|nr:uncharacterized protein BO70DRAFT_430163 [Aspergillus heteromorphus CBS 117.55]PWY78245.1 hypothetical protein BO70DRAFT_430163 [Aspergillus heteromorphus CBS 117.55]
MHSKFLVLSFLAMIGFGLAAPTRQPEHGTVPTLVNVDAHQDQIYDHDDFSHPGSQDANTDRLINAPVKPAK